MGVLVLLMLIGYLCAKIGLTNAESNKHASRIVMNVLLVGTILNSVINVDPTLSNTEILLFFGLIVLEFVVMGIVAWFSPGILGIRGADKGPTRNILLFMNNGFVGLPVVQVAFGAEAVFYASFRTFLQHFALYRGHCSA